MRPAENSKTGDLMTVTSEDVRLNLGELINRVLYRSERVRVTRRGKPVMALVPLEDLELIEKVLDGLEVEIDLPLIRERLRDFDLIGQSVPWEQVKTDRGL